MTVSRFRLLPRWIFLVGILVALTYSLVLPPPPAFTALGGDKVMHAFGYCGLAALGALGWPKRIIYVAVLVLLLGVGVELVQITLLNRALEYGDLCANTVGVAVAFSMAQFLRTASRRDTNGSSTSPGRQVTVDRLGGRKAEPITTEVANPTQCR